MESQSIDWEKYNIVQRAIFWCFLHYDITLPILLFVITVIMIINCRAATKLLESETKVKHSLTKITYRIKNIKLRSNVINVKE